MALPGVQNGTNYILLVNGRYIIFGTNASFNVAQNLRDISVRETDNWAKSIPGMREWSMEFEGLLGWVYENGAISPSKHPPLTANQTRQILEDGYFKQRPFTLVLIYWLAGSVAWFGPVTYLNGINVDTPMEDNSTISLSFSGTNAFRQEEL